MTVRAFDTGRCKYCGALACSCTKRAPPTGSIPHSALDLIRTCTDTSFTESNKMDRAHVEKAVLSINVRAANALADLALDTPRDFRHGAGK